jgi:hypothetical protein
MIGTYHCYDLGDEENDEEDLDSEKNDLYNSGKDGLVPDIVTDDLFRYFGLSETNWHPYYNYKNSIKDIRQSYLLATNKDQPYEKNGQRDEKSIELFGNPDMPNKQAHDLTILRRVIKQGPIMEAKSQILPIIIFVVIINIILLTAYFVPDDKNKFPEIGIWLFMGIVNFGLVIKLGYTWYAINHSLKREGLFNWKYLQRKVAEATNNKSDLESIDKELEKLLITNNPFPQIPGGPPNGYPGYPGYQVAQQPPQAPPTFGQEILSGVGKGIGSIISEFFKSLVSKPSNTN